jgi:hypothetical protein
MAENLLVSCHDSATAGRFSPVHEVVTLLQTAIHGAHARCVIVWVVPRDRPGQAADTIFH